MKLEQFDDALKYFQQTINEYNDPGKSYVVSAYIRECYHKKGDTENQYKWIEKTLEFGHSIGDDSLLVEIYIYTGDSLVVSAPALGAGGREFKSPHPDTIFL